MPKRTYILPRTERQSERLARQQGGNGPACLMAGIIRMAVSDFASGNDTMANDARWYFSERYESDAGHLGIHVFPDAVRDKTVGIDYE